MTQAGGSAAEMLLTDAWFARALRFSDAHSFGDADLVVQFVCADGDSEVPHHQVFEAGRLVEWRIGRHSSPGLELRQTLQANISTLTRTDLGDEVLFGTSLIDLGSGEIRWPPPLDEVNLPWGHDLPRVPTVEELVVQEILTHSPFGDVGMVVRVDEGRVVETHLGTVPEPDLVIWRRYGSALLERVGRLDVLESLEGGRVAGDYKKVTIFLGMYETDECVETRRAFVVPAVDELITLAGILSSPEWATVAARLETITGDVWSVP